MTDINRGHILLIIDGIYITAEQSVMAEDDPIRTESFRADARAVETLLAAYDTAEQRGYERGVREAAILCDRRADALDEMGLETMGLETECCVGALINCRDDILILLTQQEQDT